VQRNPTKTFVGVDDAQSVLAKSSAGVTANYDKDRVYCMIPFIWNQEIYDVSKFIFSFKIMKCKAHNLRMLQ
jgi:hypothetical protein